MVFFCRVALIAFCAVLVDLLWKLPTRSHCEEAIGKRKRRDVSLPPEQLFCSGFGMSFPFLGVPALREQLLLKKSCEIRKAKKAMQHTASCLGKHFWLCSAQGTRIPAIWLLGPLSEWNRIFWRRWDVYVHGCFTRSLSVSKTTKWEGHWIKRTPADGFRVDNWPYAVLIQIQDSTGEYKMFNERNCS